MCTEGSRLKLFGEKNGAAEPREATDVDEATVRAAGPIIEPLWSKVADSALPVCAGKVLRYFRSMEAEAKASKERNSGQENLGGDGVACVTHSAAESPVGGPAAPRPSPQNVDEPLEERFPVGRIVVGKANRYKDTYNVRGKVISYPGCLNPKVKVELLDGAAKGQTHDYAPSSLMLVPLESASPQSTVDGQTEDSTVDDAVPVGLPTAEQVAADLFNDPSLLDD